MTRAPRTTNTRCGVDPGSTRRRKPASVAASARETSFAADRTPPSTAIALGAQSDCGALRGDAVVAVALLPPPPHAVIAHSAAEISAALRARIDIKRFPVRPNITWVQMAA